MNIIQAWKAAKEGQEIFSRSEPSHRYKKTIGKNIESNSFYCLLENVLFSTMLADDWEVVKEKKSLQSELINFWRGGVPVHDNTAISFMGYVMPSNAKVTIEWED